MAIKIIKPGIFSTIQDMGREGYRSVGIGPGGVMDFFAAAVANILVGNDETSAVLEMHFPAVEILFEEDSLISITGANFSGCINDEPAGLYKPLFIKKQERLSFKKYINGSRAYIAFHGGLKSDKWLKSFSTHTKLRVGGHMGRPLLKEDFISLNKIVNRLSTDNFPDLTALTGSVYQPPDIVRCIAGPEWERLNDQSQSVFQLPVFSISDQSDRMGYRLKGMKLDMQDPFQLVSSPVDAGAIQLLPNGQLIALMADHQTTGGYPRIANVIRADLPKLAQLPIRASMQFELTNIENAEEALLSLNLLLAAVKNNCKNYYEEYRYQL